MLKSLYSDYLLKVGIRGLMTMTTFQEVETARIKYARIKRQFISEGNHYHDYAPTLPQELLDNCKVLKDRYALLEHLPKGAVCAEVGTDKGEFARKILDICEPEKLYIFELDVSRIDMPNIEAEVSEKRCEVVAGDSAANMEEFPAAFFDWIYIDANHYYDGVKKDIEVSATKLKKGGMLVLNDYTSWSPVGMTHCGVARAVNEFCIENDYELLFYAFHPMMYNDVLIRKRA